MRTQVHFNNFQKSDTVNNFIADKILQLTDKYGINPEQFSAETYLRIVRARTENRTPIFEAEFIIKINSERSFIKVSRTAEDLHMAITECFKAINFSLSKLNEKRITHLKFERRHNQYKE